MDTAALGGGVNVLTPLDPGMLDHLTALLRACTLVLAGNPFGVFLRNEAFRTIGQHCVRILDVEVWAGFSQPEIFFMLEAFAR